MSHFHVLSQQLMGGSDRGPAIATAEEARREINAAAASFAARGRYDRTPEWGFVISERGLEGCCYRNKKSGDTWWLEVEPCTDAGCS